MARTYGPTKPRNCGKGKSCGGACIARSSTCHLDLAALVEGAVDRVAIELSSNTPFGIDKRSNMDPDQNKKIARVLNVSEREAEDMADAVAMWSAGKYTRMKPYDENPELRFAVPERIKKATDDMNRFLQLAPKYQGPIYRGLEFFDATEKQSYLERLETQGETALRSMSSFTSDPKVADSFAQGGDGVVLRVTNSSQGVSVKEWVSPAAKSAKESEVVVPKGARYKFIQAQDGSDGRTYVDVEEVS